MKKCNLCKKPVEGKHYFHVVTLKNDKYESRMICPSCREEKGSEINERGWIVYMNDEWADEIRKDLDKEFTDRCEVEDELERLERKYR